MMGVNKANVIGIDADRRRLALAQVIGGMKSAWTLERTDARGLMLPSYWAAVRAVMCRARVYGAVVYLEGIYLAAPGKAVRNVDTFRVLANVQGELLFVAGEHGVDLRIVAPAQWQKRVLGFARDRAKLKEASIEAARDLMGPGLTEHESDAACLCLYGLWALRNEVA